ncbi:MAG: AraC family transcriptional regulator, partial [Bacteroidota bacterium]
AVHLVSDAAIAYLEGDLDRVETPLEKALAQDNSLALAIDLKLAYHILRKQETKMNALLEKYSDRLNAPAFQLLFRLMHQQTAPDPQLSANFGEGYMLWEVYFHWHNNNPTKALEILKAGIEKRDGKYIYFVHDPMLIPMRKHPEFQQLEQQMTSDVDLHTPLPHADISNKNAMLSIPEVADAVERLETFVKSSDFHLNPSASLSDLAKAVDLHPNKLSWLLNEHIRKNFNEYVNQFRLDTFKKLALDPAKQHLTLLGLAYESGFNSKTVFNTFFKKETGQTPKVWVKENR